MRTAAKLAADLKQFADKRVNRKFYLRNAVGDAIEITRAELDMIAGALLFMADIPERQG